jgi:hypothetical protein
MQAPYQTLQERYLGFREAVAGDVAIVCTIVEAKGPESLARSGFPQMHEPRRTRGSTKLQLRMVSFVELRVLRGSCSFRPGWIPKPDSGGGPLLSPKDVTLVTASGTSGPFFNPAQPLSIVIFRTGEPNEQHIDPGRTAGRIDRVL